MQESGTCREMTVSERRTPRETFEHGHAHTTCPVRLPHDYNYVAAFLTFRCPYHCSYCINRFHDRLVTAASSELTGRQWLDFFDRLDTHDVPVTLQGGEPGAHPDFIDIVKHSSRNHFVDILTNLAFDLKKFVRAIRPDAINRDAPYAPIRVSYHPEQFSLNDILDKTMFLVNAGFRVGIYGVTHPAQKTEIEHAQRVCADLGLDFRTKPFLGVHDGRMHGDYAYPDACTLTEPVSCECKGSELLIAPDGNVYPCHHHLYSRTDSIGNIGDNHFRIRTGYRPCDCYGNCNPCDVKVKNNRFQQFGHVSVTIRNRRLGGPGSGGTDIRDHAARSLQPDLFIN